jgi:phage terminase large subunit
MTSPDSNSSPEKSSAASTSRHSDYARSKERRAAYRQLVEEKHAEDIEKEVCCRDVVHWCQNWVQTYDPREVDADPFLPMDLFPRQKEFLEWLGDREANRENGLVEKSRDMGLTWLCCLYAVHGWLFRPGFAVGFGSRKLLLVDNLGDMDSIFEKIRFIIRNLPEWMLPKGWDEAEHDNKARIVNPDNGSSITGEGGKNIGRGGRKALYFVDEAAYLEFPQMIDRALSHTTNCRIDVSTPQGRGNPFAQKRFSGKTPVFTFHWRQDPRKDDAWYAEQTEKFDEVTVASEIDLNYDASVEGVTIPGLWVACAIELDKKMFLPRSLRIVAGQDIGEEGKDLSVFTPRAGPVVGYPIHWGRTTTTQTAWRMRDVAIEAGAQAVFFDLPGVGLGVKGTLLAAGELPFRAIGVNPLEEPSDMRWPDGRTSKELFENKKAELFWLVRRRFEKTYEHVTGVKQHPLDELISIPNHQQLIVELSIPQHERTSAGKIRMVSKKDPRMRGVKSPDFAESLVLSFCPGGHDIGQVAAARSQAEGQRASVNFPKGAGDRSRDDDDYDGYYRQAPRGNSEVSKLPPDVFGGK